MTTTTKWMAPLIPMTLAGTVSQAAAQDVSHTYGEVSQRLNELAETPEGREAASAMLAWIEKAKMFHLPWVNWVLVAAGVALLGSHLGQLVLGKLWVAVRGGGLSVVESLNDALVAGFALLALPVVMTIPIGAESFLDRPVAVLSSILVGGLFALILYFHGVRQERLAAVARSQNKGKVPTAEA
ncbi:MAG: hypothetical protein Q7Q71_13115 [Verrucomicrobiota bacterium JB023]|nr:hypothetical protein [Verrucomicrobiota bacterium JB023]